MFQYIDQIGSVIKLAAKPKRIVSIVPSQSEFLWDIGLRDELVGITKFCIHPDKMYMNTERVGGTKKLNINKIRALKPDLIIGNKEENEKADIELLQKEFNVWMSDIYTFEDAFKMMHDLGDILDKKSSTKKIVEEIKRSLPEVKNIFAGESAAYFIWYNPYMFAAKNTFIDHVLNYVGLKNAISHLKRYPKLSQEQLQMIDPDLCLLSSEPFPFKVKHIKELRDILPNANSVIVDGEIFSWYGSRLLHLCAYVKDLKKQVNNS
ncbi:MAG: ABC transporter substrate-binding protein [Bacteroidetes bacterium]|nr:ABC transporter substrate-binding protein [Bacteroidota bacterium]